MSRDPYSDVKGEVESTLGTTRALLDSYERIASSSSSPTSPAVLEARKELQGTLALLEADLEDLEESVRAVERTGDRWGIEEHEVRRRRQFVERIKTEVRGLRDKAFPRGPGGKGKEKNGRNAGRYTDNPDDPEAGRNDADDIEEARRWEAEEQQMLMRRQDDTLGVISGTLHNLASQAGLIGHEVGEQSEMLDDLTTRVDSTDSRLRKVSRTMQDFIRRNEGENFFLADQDGAGRAAETKSGWCICILIFILIILLILVILT